MAIRFAFNTVACPDWTLAQAAARAQEWGFAGLELRTLGGTGPALASDPAVIGPTTVQKTLRDAGVEAACLSTSIALHYTQPDQVEQALEQAQQAFDLARGCGAAMVRLYGYQIEPGHDRGSVLARIAERAAILAQAAQARGLTLVLENAGNLARARDWWTMMDVADQPNLGVCWNLAAAALAGEGPGVSVPMLSRWIKFAKVTDATIGDECNYVTPGQGQAHAGEFVRRLMGVGYAGWLGLEWPKLWLPELAPAEEYLPQALAAVRGWIDEVEKAKEAAKPKPKAKPAAHAVAKA